VERAMGLMKERPPYSRRGSEPLDPHYLMVDVNPTFVKQYLKVAEEEVETDLRHHREADDFGQRFATLAGAAFRHARTLLSALSCFKPSSFDRTFGTLQSCCVAWQSDEAALADLDHHERSPAGRSRVMLPACEAAFRPAIDGAKLHTFAARASWAIP
jgi:hypothetical protein